MKIAVIDKNPSRNDYSKYFKFEFELFHLCQEVVPKLLKKDITLEIDLDQYDFVILVGADAAKHVGKISNISDYAGQLMKGKFICITNPAILVFKPEEKQNFERALAKLHKYIDGSLTDAAISGDFKLINNADDALNYIKMLLELDIDRISMDCEATALYPRDGYVLGISISYKADQGVYINSEIITEEFIEYLQKLLDRVIVIFHNMKYDIKMIEFHFGVKFNRNKVHDTMVMHYVLDENDGHGLKPLAIKYTNYGDYDTPLEEFKANYCSTHGILKDDFTYDMIPFDILGRYACIDTAVTLQLSSKFLPIIEDNQNFTRVYYKIMLPGTLMFMDMEEVGIPIDVDRMKAADFLLENDIEDARKKLYTYPEVLKFEQDSGTIFNPNSVMQLRKVLFDYIGLPTTGKLTATFAHSTDAEVLTELSELHPFPSDVLTYKKLTKIRNTYVTKILPQIDMDGRIRTNFNLIFTTSGRASSSGKFNAQQIVRDDPIIKGCIKAPVGYKIVSQDLQTGEMYFAAVLSGDKNLQKVFLNPDGDFHSNIAKTVFKLNCLAKEVKSLYPELRQSAKAISFGILYGSGPDKVAETVSKATRKPYSRDQALEDIEAYFNEFKSLKKWLKSREAFIKTNGYTYSFFGRKRRLLNVFSTDKGIAAHDVRSGINAEIQSLCSDINLLAAIDTANELKTSGLDAKIFMLVHDSIVAIVRESDVDKYKEILARNTQKDRGCSIPGKPIGIDQEVGDDYSFGKFDKVYEIIGNKLSRIPAG